jgi:hypothetical protein
LNAERTIKSYVLHKYGLNISADTPQYDQKSGRWIADIKSDYPIYLQDDRNPENVLLHFIPIRHIGKVSFDERLSPLADESTPRERCLKNVQSLLKCYSDRTERIVVQASADSFVQIPEFRHFFTPIDQILSSLLEEDCVPIENLMKHRPVKSQVKINQYLKLLESMDIISYNDGNIRTSKMYWFLHNHFFSNDKSAEEEFRKAIISELLKVKYSALTQVFATSRLQPSIHIDSCIYKPALEAEDIICLSTKSISTYYTAMYGNINEYTLVNHLRRLHSVGAIGRQGEFWCGKQELLENMVELKKNMPELCPPFVH